MIETNTNCKIIAVWGSPGSGKTTLAVNAASILAESGYMTCLLSANYFGEPQGFFGTAIPNDKGLYSALTSSRHISESLTEAQKDLCLLEQDARGDGLDVANVTTAQFEQITNSLSDIFQYLIIDCTSYNSSVFTGMGLVAADIVLMCLPHRASAATWFIANKQMIDALKGKILFIDSDTREGGVDMEQLLSSIGISSCAAKLNYVASAYYWENAGKPVVRRKGRSERRYRQNVMGILSLLMDYDAQKQFDKRAVSDGE